MENKLQRTLSKLEHDYKISVDNAEVVLTQYDSKSHEHDARLREFSDARAVNERLLAKIKEEREVNSVMAKEMQVQAEHIESEKIGLDKLENELRQKRGR